MEAAGQQEYQTVVLAALLHDIGKFLRTGRSLDFVIEGTHADSLRLLEEAKRTVEAAIMKGGKS